MGMRWRKYDLDLVEQIKRPQVFMGIDWGVDGNILVRYGELELWWCPGHTFWNGAKSEYSDGQLIGWGGHNPWGGIKIFSGGRCSQKRFEKAKFRIGLALKLPADIHSSISKQHTLIVADAQSA